MNFFNFRKCRSPRSIRTGRRFIPMLQALESRHVPAPLIVLDFDGISASEIEFLRARVRCNRDLESAPGLLSFVGEFAALQDGYGGYAVNQYLDFDGNGALDADDGELAAKRVMARVREDFAPYNVTIVREDHTPRAVELLQTNSAHDALIHVDGHHSNTGGQAPFDSGNDRDDAGMAGGSVGVAVALAGDPSPPDIKAAMFINQIANFVSHEIGHTFGLDHILYYEAPAWGTSMMPPFLGAENLTFADVTYETGTGPQNEHRYLTRVLGASHQAWAAVLRPGELTITGSSADDKVEIIDWGAGDWVVLVNLKDSPNPAPASFYRVDSTCAPDVYSLNPFPTPIQTIHFAGGRGNDSFWVFPEIFATVKGRGGRGNDSMYGGARADLILGEGGADQLFGRGDRDELRGGDGTDIIVGGDSDDTVKGGDGRDLLIGGLGPDQIQGNDGQDLLIAGPTVFDNDPAALAALLAEWTSSRGYAARLDNLRGVGTGPRENGDFFLIRGGPGATVFEDGEADNLLGNGRRDWFFANLDGGVADEIGGRGDDEEADEISIPAPS
jgi:Ca2+-binding RTX toxin-like protein